MSSTKESVKPAWKMPAWMEPYRKMFNNTGGNTIEELMNTTGKQANVFTNAPLAMICVAVKSEVSLLTTLHEAGCLKPIDSNAKTKLEDAGTAPSPDRARPKARTRSGGA